MRVLFVCTGNICRSAMAEAMLRDALERRGCRDVEVASAGTWASTGHPASQHAVEVLRSRGVDLSSHSATELARDALDSADLIVAMTSVHKREILALAPEIEGKIVLMKELAEMQPERTPERSAGARRLAALLDAPRPAWRRALDLDDPMGMPIAGYERTATELEAGVAALVEILCGRENTGDLEAPG